MRNHHTSQSSDGIQPWSKGEFYPWVWACVSDFSAPHGKMFYRHPDGRKSAIVYYGEDSLSFREAHQLLDDIMESIFTTADA